MADMSSAYRQELSLVGNPLFNQLLYDSYRFPFAHLLEFVRSIAVNKDSGFRVLMILASTVLVIAGIKYSADFFVPVMLALFIATISYPITHWLRCRTTSMTSGRSS